MAKISVDNEGMRSLLETARRAGTVDRWCDLAIDWIDQAWNHIKKMEGEEDA